MNATKQAIVLKVVSDTGTGGLVALIGNSAQYPDVKFAYRNPEMQTPEPSSDAAGSLPLMTYHFVAEAPMPPRIPRHEETYQFDIWSTDPDLNGKIAKRLTDLFRFRSQPPTGAALLPDPTGQIRVDSVQKTLETETYDAVQNMWQTTLQFMVTSFEIA